MQISPYLGAAAVLTALGGMMVLLHSVQKAQRLHPEVSRKLVHMGMGMVTLTFPWLFHSPWPVAILGTVAATMLVAVKRASWLKSTFGSVLGAVDRASLGDIYFPVAVAVLFAISHGDPILYCIPVLILTFGDACAALIGIRYGTKHYAGVDGNKSFEGSIAFFTVTFLCVHVPLLLFTDTGRPQCLLIGLTLAVIAMLIESVAWGGLDNLFLPLGGYVLLHTFLHLTTEALIIRLSSICGLVIFVILWRRRSTLRGSALIAAALLAYACWAAGGLRWLLPPLLLFVAYPVLTAQTPESQHRSHSVASVVSVMSAGLLWLFLGHIRMWPAAYYPFTLSFAIQLALITIVRMRHYDSPRSAAQSVWTATLFAWAIQFLPYFLVMRGTPETEHQLLLSLAVVAVSAVVFSLADRGRPTDARLLLRQAIIALVGSFAGLMAS